jgi:hypothetical protein
MKFIFYVNINGFILTEILERSKFILFINEDIDKIISKLESF